MRHVLLVGLLVLTSLYAHTQTDKVIARANQLLQEYETTYTIGQTTAAREYLEEGIRLLQNQDQDTLLGKFYNLYTYWYYQEGQSERALWAQQEAVRLFQRGYGAEEPTAFALHNVAYLQARVAGQPDSAIYYYHQGRQIYEKLNRPIDVADEWRNIGLIHYGQNNYRAARDAYLSAVKILKPLTPAGVAKRYPNQEENYIKTLSWLYLNLAELAHEEEDMRQVRIYLHYAQDVLLPYGEKYPLLAREAQENQARIYGYLGDVPSSLQAYQELLDATDPKEDARFYQRLLAAMAQIYSGVQGDYTDALGYWERLLANNSRSQVAGSLSLARYHREMARCYLELERWAEAESTLAEAQKWLLQNPEAQEQGFLLFLQAYLAHRRHQPTRALQFLAETRAAFDFPLSSSRANQERLEGEIDYQLFKTTGKTDYLREGERWARISLETLVAFEEETFKRRSFGQEYRKSTDLLLRCLLERYPTEPEVLTEIFQLIEQSKGRSLRLGQHWEQQRLAQQGTDKRNSFAELERARLQLLDRRQQITSTDTILLLALSDSLVVLNQRWDALRRTLPGPQADLAGTADIATIEGQLLPNEALVDFFLGDSILVAVTLTKEGTYLYQQKLASNWPSLLKELVDAVSQPKPSALLGAHSHNAYESFLAPLLKQLPTVIDRLIVVPDGLLAELPWPALCTALPQGTDYRQWPFLVHDYHLSYLTYAGALLQRREKRARQLSVACFAPTYPDIEVTDTLAQLATLRNSSFWPLPGAAREATAISELYGRRGNLFQGAAATRKMFEQEAAGYSLLHLAMHAVADEYAPDDSYLLFANQDQELQPLSSLALLGLELNTDLMILSACYAGSGPWRAGEGVQSMAYTLRQTGVQSVLSNTWTVADQLSDKLMLEFHRQLLEEAPLDAALRSAQRHFIATAAMAEAAHPYYWAGFRLQGNTAAFTNGGLGNWIWWCLGMIIAILFVGYFVFQNRT